MRDRTVAHRILILEEDPAIAQDLSSRLRSYGYEVVGVFESTTVAASARDVPDPDVVLASLDFPRGAGETAIEAGSRWGVPTILLVAPDRVRSLPEAGVHGPFGFVVAPFAERELRMNIEMALLKEARAREARELQDQFFALNIDLLCQLDFAGYFRQLNPAWERTLGFTLAELRSKPFIEFVHPDDRERTIQQNLAVRNGSHAQAFENRYLCKDGSYRWLMWNAAPDPGERTIYATARDITARKRAEEEREIMLAQLQTAFAEVRTLQEILPICSYCRKIRDDANYWQTVEAYISAHTNTMFSHGICPSCYATEVEPQFDPGSGEG